MKFIKLQRYFKDEQSFGIEQDESVPIFVNVDKITFIQPCISDPKFSAVNLGTPENFYCKTSEIKKKLGKNLK